MDCRNGLQSHSFTSYTIHIYLREDDGHAYALNDGTSTHQIWPNIFDEYLNDPNLIEIGLLADDDRTQATQCIASRNESEFDDDDDDEWRRKEHRNGRNFDAFMNVCCLRIFAQSNIGRLHLPPKYISSSFRLTRFGIVSALCTTVRRNESPQIFMQIKLDRIEANSISAPVSAPSVQRTGSMA